jgi:hypothetical protein
MDKSSQIRDYAADHLCYHKLQHLRRLLPPQIGAVTASSAALSQLILTSCSNDSTLHMFPPPEDNHTADSATASRTGSSASSSDRSQANGLLQPLLQSHGSRLKLHSNSPGKPCALAQYQQSIWRQQAQPCDLVLVTATGSSSSSSSSAGRWAETHGVPGALVYAALLSVRQPALLLAMQPSSREEWLAGFQELRQQEYFWDTVCSKETQQAGAGAAAGLGAGAAAGAAAGGGATGSEGSTGGRSWCYAKVGGWWGWCSNARLYRLHC